MKNTISILTLFVVFFDFSLQAEDTVPLQKRLPQKKIKKDTAITDMAPRSRSISQPYVSSLDVYGSRSLTPQKIRKAFGKELDQWIAKGLSGDRSADVLQLQLSAKVKEKFNLAFARWSILHYFEPGNLALNITLDVVEKKDRNRRMPFISEPTGKYEDPSHLIETWIEYERTAMQLVDIGQLDPTVSRCRTALHCPFAHEHPKLKRFEQTFTDGVAKNEAKLIQILTNDKRAFYRAASAYLLAYLPDGNKVISLMLSSINDPKALVRNNALRVLGDIAESHPKYRIPTKPIIAALDYPLVSDRSKAAYVLVSMLNHSKKAKKEIHHSAVPSLIKMLQSEQPNHYEVAYDILKQISGKDYGKTNNVAWRTWYKKSRMPAQTTKSKRLTPVPKPSP